MQHCPEQPQKDQMYSQDMTESFKICSSSELVGIKAHFQTLFNLSGAEELWTGGLGASETAEGQTEHLSS